MAGLYKILPANSRFIMAVLVTVLLASAARPAYPDDEFGRFFTTPKQRERLDELRSSASNVVVNVNEDELRIDEDVKKTEQQHNELTLKGLVYRSDGKNAAWINDSNSYEGDVASGVTSVKEHEISSSGVEMELPGDKKKIRLKVGEAYDSSGGKTSDIVPGDDIIKK